MSQGKGIFLSRNLDHILDIVSNQKTNPHLDTEEKCGYVVQTYIDRPHLVDALKYDLRLYVMIYGVNPLRIYLHKMAFARFCTEAYKRPTNSNLKNNFMHLTNYAINKFSDNY
jgi:tubulin polyglutamylase TTLL6/13